MSEKYNAAQGAFEIIEQTEGQLVMGIGTGSTTDYFTREFLPKIKERVVSVYSSSKRTINLRGNFTILY